MTDHRELDDLILSVAKMQWQKTAMIIVRVVDKLELEYDDSHGRGVVERVEHLVRQKRLEARGDLARWRLSEVRLPPASS